MARAGKKEPQKSVSKSLGSATTEPTKRDQAIKELGHKLIAELEDRDITAKWMAAYLAEQITASEEDPSLKPETSDLVLKLWEKRRHYPGRNIMERYEKALSAMELHLSTGEPVFRIWSAFEPRDRSDNDQVGLARKLKHHTEGLAALLIKFAIRQLDLDKDQLAELADIAAPDAEAKFMRVLKVVAYEEEKEKTKKDPYSEVREEIAELREVLDEIEAEISPQNSTKTQLQ